MGNRVKGRTKKKSIKAASHSGMGSKRKLSRMGKKQQKNKSGLDATFIGRSACLKKLQVTLKDFRRLCILKGVYPRDPRGRTPSKKKGQTYYHIKDVKALAHEPVLEKFREFRAFMKKVRKAAGRGDPGEARRLQALSPSYTLFHLVKERYPRFGDALGDLDDALALVYLFAALPSKGRIAGRITNKAKELAGHWGSYVAVTGALTKCFVSVKGIYMEADVEGVCVRWVVPHAFTQNVPDDVDYRVMNTFFEFYETLLAFVLFKLYKDLGIRYPMQTITQHGEEAAGSLGYRMLLERTLRGEGGVTAGSAVTEAVRDNQTTNNIPNKDTTETNKNTKKLSPKEQAKIESVDTALVHLPQDNSDSEDEQDEVDVATPLLAALQSVQNENQDEDQPSDPNTTLRLSTEATKRRSLFRNLVIFLSREIPTGYIDTVAIAHGAQLGWDGPDSPFAVTDPRITHHIIDRPSLSPLSFYDKLPKSREYVQPQWLLDSANFEVLLPVGRYAVGKPLPPHLSPWVVTEDGGEGGYKPRYAEEIEKFKKEGVMGSMQDQQNELNMDETPGDTTEITNEESNAMVSKEDKDSSSASEEDGTDDEDDSDGDNDMDNVDEDEIDAKAREKANKRKEKAAEEEKLLARGMMSKKANRLYDRMQHGIAKKQAVVDNLHRRRKEIETDKKRRTPEGHTILKAKVERLKEERRTIEKEYEENSGATNKKKRKQNRVRNRSRKSVRGC